MATQEQVLRTCAGRLATFDGPQQIAKRRASSAKKKQANAASWPHENPSPEQLAKAGFYYKPTGSSLDNVICFLCNKSLDGWEDGDNPVREHVKNVPGCAWAILTDLERGMKDENETRAEMHPMSEEMIEARRATFHDAWPHEHRKGWKCKVKKMVEAGWSYSPMPEADDCVKCVYCGVSLDGWEPKDDPWEEHQRRAPDCAFFSLLEEANKISKQPKAKAKKARVSKASSKASRLSTQSAITEHSDLPSFISSEGGPTEEGDTVMTIASNASKATRGAKKGTTKRKPQARARAGTRSKKAEPVEALSDVDAAVTIDHDASIVELQKEESKPKKSRQAKKQNTASIENDATTDQISEEVPLQTERKPGIRGRGAKKQTSEDADGDHETTEQGRESSVSLTKANSKATRGRKRTSDGIEKLEISTMAAEEASTKNPKTKAKRSRNPRDTGDQTSDLPLPDENIHSVDPPATSLQAAKPKPRTKKVKVATAKTKNAETAVSEAVEQSEQPAIAESRVAPVQRTATKRDQNQTMQDVSEAEIQSTKAAELTVASKSKSGTQTKVDQSRPLPAPSQPAEELTEQLQARASNATRQLDSAQQSSTPNWHPNCVPISPSQSPQSSDAENKPPSSHPSQQKTKSSQSQQEQPAYQMDTSAVRSPLADRTSICTPSRTTPSASNGLVSTEPWTAVDLERALLPSNTFLGEDEYRSEKLDVRGVLQTLSSPEKQMTVEEWIKWNAGKAEEKLRRGCEGMIGEFESEGVRALNSLRGIE